MTDDKFFLEELIAEYINDLSLLQKNKYSIKQANRMFYGILFELIQNKLIFKKNEDLKVFTEFITDIAYKDYLFASRSLLASRVIKDLSFIESNTKRDKVMNSIDNINNINKKESFEKDALISNAIKSTQRYLKSLEVIKEYSEKNKKNGSSIQAKEIIAWMKFINNKDI